SLQLLYSVTFQQRFVLWTVSPAQAFFSYKVLHPQYSINDRFRAWRATGNINIYRNYLIDSLEYAVCIEDSAAAGAGANGNYPAGFSHLEIDLFYYRPHFLCNSTHHHEQVTLPGRETDAF